ncbi:hypothetical protein CEXT_796741 [Caerostris extrusa]|uniref:Uncharacterized protein n=1 Tax=Caerostris extrusa TaxID=172846 RepID=A0AAV4S8F3_CAEEX|nr:hypothetical protein CEXT_796741 [Caerostris extrusa]
MPQSAVCRMDLGMRRLQYFHIVTYAVWMLFLIPSLFIFVNYKQLQVVPHHDAQAPVHRPAAQRPHVHHLQELHHPGAAGPALGQDQHGPRGERSRSCILILDSIITEKGNSST